MNLFFSGGLLDRVEYDPRLDGERTRYRLVSCHGAYVRPGKKVIEAMIDVDKPFELMLDSGAFTSWTQGHEVVLDDLIQIYDAMLEQYSDRAVNTWLISLDKIPGERGRTASAEEIVDACRISDENFLVLQKRYGKCVLPVFHQNESTERLHEVAAMAPYICVSPRNDLHEGSRRSWSKEVHELIPGKRTHGLAATGYAMMSRVSWGSVDSATWVLLAANGSILFGDRLQVIKVSNQAGTLKDKDQHYRTYSPSVQKVILNYIEANGFTMDGLESDAYERMIFNRRIMDEFASKIPDAHTVLKSVPAEIPLFGL